MGVIVVQCSQCGMRFQIDPARFAGQAQCTRCGAILPSGQAPGGASAPAEVRSSAAPGTKVCPTCNGVVPVDLAVCLDCGYNFRKGGLEGESRRRAGLGPLRQRRSLAGEALGWRVTCYGLHAMFLAGIALCCAALISAVVCFVLGVEAVIVARSATAPQAVRHEDRALARTSAAAAAGLTRALYFLVPMIAVGVGVKFFEGLHMLIWIGGAAYLAVMGMLFITVPKVGVLALVASVVALLLLVVAAGVLTLVGLAMCLFVPVAPLRALLVAALAVAGAGAAALVVAGVQGIGASRHVLDEGMESLAVHRLAGVAIGVVAGFVTQVWFLLFLRGVTDVAGDEETRNTVRTYFAFYVSLTGGSLVVGGLNLAGVLPAALATLLSLAIFAYSVVAFVWFVRVIAAVRDVVR